MNLFDSVIAAYQQVYYDTQVMCTEIHLHPEDVSELRRDERFLPSTREHSLVAGTLRGTIIEVKANTGTRIGWVNMHGHGLKEWKLMRLKPALPPVTAWDKINGEDLV